MAKGMDMADGGYRSGHTGAFASDTADAAGLVAGALLDAALGDPRRWHPVAGFGRAAAALERRLYAPSRAAGTGYAVLATGAPVALATAAAWATRRRPWLRAGLVAVTTWAVLGGTTLRREARAVADSLAGGDLPAARQRLPHLCGRDPSTLDESDLARATVESVAENSSDAEVAPLVWGAVAGLPGLVGYRAVNTLDAMVGPRSAGAGGARCGRGCVTVGTIPAPTPAAARRRWPARSGSASAAATSTPVGWRTGRCSATGAPPSPRTSGRRPGSRPRW